jgi:hypothetical protein
MVNVVTLNYESSLDRFISEEKNVVYKTVSSKKLAGWMGGWMEGKAGLRIAYSNQKLSMFVNISAASISAQIENWKRKFCTFHSRR